MQQKGSFSMPNPENSESRQYGISAKKGVTGVHTAAEVFISTIALFACELVLMHLK